MSIYVEWPHMGLKSPELGHGQFSCFSLCLSSNSHPCGPDKQACQGNFLRCLSCGMTEGFIILP